MQGLTARGRKKCVGWNDFSPAAILELEIVASKKQVNQRKARVCEIKNLLNKQKSHTIPNEVLGRQDISENDVKTALEKISCQEIRGILQKQIEESKDEVDMEVYA